jgi:hypothetical protein
MRPTSKSKLSLHGSTLTAGAGLFGPAGAWMVNPIFGMALTGVEVCMAVAILLTALYGNKLHSSRAFRLLCWTFDRAEPPARRAPQ